MRYRPTRLGDLRPIVEHDERGVVRLRAARPLGAYPRSLTDKLEQWARLVPDRTLLAWRDGPVVGPKASRIAP